MPVNKKEENKMLEALRDMWNTDPYERNLDFDISLLFVTPIWFNIDIIYKSNTKNTVPLIYKVLRWSIKV